VRSQPAKSGNDNAYTAKVWRVTSQTWRTPAEIDRTVWEHWLTIIDPRRSSTRKGLVFIDAAVTEQGTARAQRIMATIATMTNSVVADLKMIPNQPMKFPDEKDAPIQGKGVVRMSSSPILGQMHGYRRYDRGPRDCP